MPLRAWEQRRGWKYFIVLSIHPSNSGRNKEDQFRLSPLRDIKPRLWDRVPTLRSLCQTGNNYVLCCLWGADILGETLYVWCATRGRHQTVWMPPASLQDSVFPTVYYVRGIAIRQTSEPKIVFCRRLHTLILNQRFLNVGLYHP